jgi:hypothetical protein
MQYFNNLVVNHPRVMAMIDRLAETGSVVVPTLHIFAQRFGLAYFTSPSLGAFDRTDGLSEEQRKQAVAGYRIL